MGGNGKHRWKISFHNRSNSNPKPTLPPKDFLCPITGALMSDPVVISSGQTFERVSAQVCRDLGFSPTLEDSDSVPDFTNIIPNLAIKSTILTWCDSTGAERPSPPDYGAVEKIVRAKMVGSGSLRPEIGASERELLKGVAENRAALFIHAATEVTRRVSHFYSSSEESVVVGDEPGSPFTPLPLATRPACYTSFSNSSSENMGAETLNQKPDSNSGNSNNSGPISNSSSEIMGAETLNLNRDSNSGNSNNSGPISNSSEIVEAETLNLTQDSNSGNSGPILPLLEEQEIVARLKNLDVHEQEEAVISLRKLTRAREDLRIALCTPRLLAALRSLIDSRYSAVQTNAIASLVNLSLARANKVTIVRSGFVPLLIDVLITGPTESQDHAAGALFSLALEDENKMAIGVLGALQPLMHGLRSESEPTRHDSALALYHLSLIQSNRVKLVKLGAVPALLSMVAGGTASRLLLILCNLAACNEGRSAMLDGNAVAILVEMMREDESAATRENCVAALFALSHGSLRFKGLAKEAGAVEVLREVAERGSQRGREKARKILQMMKGRGEEDEQWGGILESEGTTRGRYSVSAGTRNRKSWNC